VKAKTFGGASFGYLRIELLEKLFEQAAERQPTKLDYMAATVQRWNRRHPKRPIADVHVRRREQPVDRETTQTAPHR
jgi:hypothetical protein